jgi:arsenate reductase-like glutaredoxin family protein
LKDPTKIKRETLAKLLETSSRQLEESCENLEDIKALLPLAKTAQERTTLNIILDNQRKVVKSLERLTNDLSEING